VNYLAVQQKLNNKEAEDLLFWLETTNCLDCLFESHSRINQCKKNQGLNQMSSYTHN
jgi:hypothetical protein